MKNITIMTGILLAVLSQGNLAMGMGKKSPPPPVPTGDVVRDMLDINYADQTLHDEKTVYKDGYHNKIRILGVGSEHKINYVWNHEVSQWEWVGYSDYSGPTPFNLNGTKPCVATDSGEVVRCNGSFRDLSGVSRKLDFELFPTYMNVYLDNQFMGVFRR